MADTHSGRFRAAFLRNRNLAVPPEVEAQVEAAFRAGRLDLVEAAVDWQGIETPMAADFEKTHLKTLQAAGKASEQFLPPEVFIRFDQTNPLATKWAAERSSTLVREVSKTTVQALRNIMEAAFEEGLHPRVAAKRIVDTVGLTEYQDKIARNFHLRQVDMGVDPGVAEKQTSKYRKKLLKRRATLIARTESIASSSEGQQQLWQQSADAGLLDKSVTKREVIVTPDDRLDSRICLPMAGQQRGLDEPFETGIGTLVMMPPFHPGCRCGVALAVVSVGAK